MTRIFSITLSLILLEVSGCFAQSSDSLIVQSLREKGITFSHDNNVKLLTTGQEKFDAEFQAIRNARYSVHLEYFNFRNDSIGNELFRLLEHKAESGVKVRALYDAFGNKSNNRPLKKNHLTEMRSHGVEIEVFDPIRFPWITNVFSRDHRKIVVIDDSIAFIGGMNVADYYIHGTPKIGPWRDLHCSITGTEVATLQKIFQRAWKKETGREAVNDSSLSSPKGNMMVGIINREPHKTNKIMRQFYISCFDNAKDTIRLVNPYLSLTHSVKKAIKRALKRGLHIEIMMSQKSDIPMEPDASFYHLHWMMKKGAKVYIFQDGFHHTKTITVDGKLTTVGSCNLDARSLAWDYECNAVIVNKDITRQIDQRFINDKAKSFLLTEESWDNWRSRWKKTYGWMAQLLSIWL